MTTSRSPRKRQILPTTISWTASRKNKEYTKTGAIGLFIGVARGENNEGEKVQKLTLEAYEEKANEVLQKICDDLAK